MKTWKSDRSQKFPRLYQWSTILGGLDFSRSLFLVYFVSLGFSGAETGILQATLFWTSFALELPSGIVADKFGRKKSIVLGLAGLIVTFAILATAQTFAWAMAGFAMWGASFAFISGAGAALLYDGLKESGKIETHLYWLSRIRSFGTVALGASIVVGGFLYEWVPNSIFWATAVTAFLGLGLILLVPEPRLHETAAEHPGTIQSLKNFFKSEGGRNLLIFLAGMAAFEMAVTPFFIFSQSLFHAQGLSEKGISLVLGFGFLLSAFAQANAPRARGFSVMALVTAVGVSVALGLASLALSPVLAVQIFLFAAVNSLPMFLYVHTDQYIQDHCESRIRASLLSVQSFINAVPIGLSYLAIGFLSDRIGMAKTLACLGLPVLIGIGLVALHFGRVRKG